AALPALLQRLRAIGKTERDEALRQVGEEQRGGGRRQKILCEHGLPGAFVESARIRTAEALRPTVRNRVLREQGDEDQRAQASARNAAYRDQLPAEVRGAILRRAEHRRGPVRGAQAAARGRDDDEVLAPILARGRLRVPLVQGLPERLARPRRFRDGPHFVVIDESRDEAEQ